MTFMSLLNYNDVLRSKHSGKGARISLLFEAEQ